MAYFVLSNENEQMKNNNKELNSNRFGRVTTKLVFDNLLHIVLFFCRSCFFNLDDAFSFHIYPFLCELTPCNNIL